MENRQNPLLQHSITPFFATLRRGQEFLLDAQLRILREENFADENLVRREIARGDGGGIIDVLDRIDQDRAGLVFKGVIIRPDRQNSFGGIAQINFEPLLARKIEDDGPLRDVLERQVYLELAHLGQLHWLGRQLQLEDEPAQPSVFVSRRRVRRLERMQHPGEPAALFFGRRRRLLRGKTSRQRESRDGKSKRTAHERLISPESFRGCVNCQTHYQSAMKTAALATV